LHDKDCPKILMPTTEGLLNQMERIDVPPQRTEML